MTTKVDSMSTEESQHAQSPISKSTSANSASGPKVSIFGVKSGFVIPKNKSGFVIPKNKLSGSLVPIVRGGGKVETGDERKEDNSKQVQRKTRWDADLSQDAAVRKGRSLAYQTRLEQITQQLKSGSLELGDDQDSQLPGQPSHVDSVDQSTVTKLHRHELLELEKREVIGEILRLNPGYKAPPDYMPVLKEARIPIPLKGHPGNNFIGLILGPASNTQKRLEEETGAKVRVYGIKLDTKEKCEITRSDATEAQAVYEELFVHISAESYDKVDAAVALIELLVTPVSAVSAVASTTSSSVSGDVVEQSQKNSVSAHMTMPVGVVNQGMVQPMAVPAHSVMPQFQAYAGPWHPHGSPNVLPPQSAGFIRPPVFSNMQFTPPTNLLNAPFSGGHPAFGMVPRNVPGIVTRPEPSMQSLQQPLPTVPPSHTNTIQQTPPAYPGMASPSTSVLPAVSPSISSGSMPAARPTHLGPQPTTSGGFPYNRPLSTPPGSSPGFSAGPLPLRPNNMTHMVPPSSTPLQRPHPLIPQNNVALPSQPSMPTPAVNGHPAANFSPRIPLQSSNVPSNLPSAPHGGQIPAPAVGSLLAPAPIPTFLPPHAPVPSPRLLPSMRGQASIPASLPGPSHQPVPPISGPALGSSPSFPLKLPLASPVSVPPITSPKPQQPSPGDFTFQPHKTQVSASVTSSMPSQPVPHTSSQVSLGAAQTPLNQNASQLPFAPPTAPSFRPAAQSPPIPIGSSGALRPQSVGQMGPPHQVPLQSPSFPSGRPFPGNPTNVLAPPRIPAFQNANAPPSPQLGLRNFAPAIPNVSTPIPSRPAPLVQAQPPPGHHHPHGLAAPGQHVAVSLPGYVPARPASTPGGGQIYDPFSPTSITAGPRRQEDDPAKRRKPETDAEYEDLMASVGVR
ncbi:hypothetical protein Taro_040161 [Colocasia esculenta]|uniref:K Homology domain-containing protein n=1 Tax=Colocasia esculenta TaxID=4460 RepID=A0A843WPG0_COLES|nr:hypothetical protein [Colocasia esculenta]